MKKIAGVFLIILGIYLFSMRGEYSNRVTRLAPFGKGYDTYTEVNGNYQTYTIISFMMGGVGVILLFIPKSKKHNIDSQNKNIEKDINSKNIVENELELNELNVTYGFNRKYEELIKLKELLDKGIINQDEFNVEKEKVLHL